MSGIAKSEKVRQINNYIKTMQNDSVVQEEISPDSVRKEITLKNVR